MVFARNSMAGMILVGLIFAPSLLSAQIIQLPTVEVFSISTTVSVPDSGSGFLGGVKRGSHGSSMSGAPMFSKIPGANRMFANRGIGSSAQSGSARVSATIIDLAEMDEAILGDGQRTRNASAADSAVAKKAAFLSQNVSRRPAEDPLERRPPARKANDVLAIQEQAEAAQKEKENEAVDYFQRGQRAEANSKPDLAKAYYQMASRRCSGDLKTQIDARLTSLNQQEPAPAKVARK